MNNAVTTKSKGIIRIRKINDLNSLFILAFCFMAYGQNSYLDIALLAIIFGIFVFNLNKDVFCLYYFAIIFFDSVLILPFVSGSVFRVYQLLFLMKILLDTKNRVTFKVPPIYKIVLMVILITWSVMTSQGMSTTLSLIINISILLYIFYRVSSSIQKDAYYSQMLFITFLFSFLSGIYGLYKGVASAGLGYSRLSGTIGDPNYTALFYLLGAFSLLGTSEISSSRVKAILFSIMCFFILSTVSLTGITGLVVLLIFYYIFKDKKIASLLIVALIIAVVCIASLPIESGALHVLKSRVIISMDSIANSDFTLLTSNRSDLASFYLSNFFTQSPGAIMFGGRNIIAGNDREYFLNMVNMVSHNSYIDMLYAVGIVGTVFILACFTYDIVRYLRKYKSTKKEHFLAFAFLKLTILWFCMGLSMFPFRYFLTYMFL